MGTNTVRAGQPRGGMTSAQQKAANKLANELMRADGLDPVKDQKLRVQYYIRAKADILTDVIHK